MLQMYSPLNKFPNFNFSICSVPAEAGALNVNNFKGQDTGRLSKHPIGRDLWIEQCDKKYMLNFCYYCSA